MANYLLVSCDTQTPVVDDENPNFLFKITGDGFDQTFDQDTDFDSFQLNLREDAEYDLVLSAGDSGGTKQIQWQYAHDYIEFETSIPSPWTVTTTRPSTVLNWSGNLSSPITGMILTGTFRANGDLVSHVFFFKAQDFFGGGVYPLWKTPFIKH
jgi:hypothetical protein